MTKEELLEAIRKVIEKDYEVDEVKEIYIINRIKQIINKELSN